MEITSANHDIEYMKTVNLIYKLSKKYISQFADFQDLRLNIGLNIFNGFFEMRIGDSEIGLSILPRSKWQHIKARLNSDILNLTIDCSLCSMEMDNKRVACNSCGCLICANCYITLYKKGKGIIKCNSCSSQHGRICSRKEIEEGIKLLQSNFFN